MRLGEASCRRFLLALLRFLVFVVIASLLGYVNDLLTWPSESRQFFANSVQQASGRTSYSRIYPERSTTQSQTDEQQSSKRVADFGLEAGWVELGPADTLSVAHHIPVILYLIPVAYAGLVYGREGGVLTGLWAGTLASINVVLFSLDDFEWVLEILFVALVVGIGIVTALPVERERVQRRRAEAAVRRLEALNDLAHVSMPARARHRQRRRC